MAKNIVVLSDGTGQEGGEGVDSNVYKLFKMLLNRSPKQIVFYDSGVGTGWRKLGGRVGGAGISKNILECYRFIFDHYEAGDRIFMFGFSRGAATVRSLSGFIHRFGVLPKSRPELIEQAYGIYRISNDERRNEKVEGFHVRHHTMWTKDIFLGVWDTVAALGAPINLPIKLMDKVPFFKHRFHDFELSRSVSRAYQALAIDDERKAFHPALWDSEIQSYQCMQQVWFCGMHTDVGGGRQEAGLSDIALEWMLAKAKDYGLELYPEHEVPLEPSANGKMHDSREGLGRLYRKLARSWPADRTDRPVIHESVNDRKRGTDNSPDSPYEPWILRDWSPKQEPPEPAD